MNEELDLLKSASNEIKTLRQQNQNMATRLQMFDDMMLVFRSTQNFQSQGMSPDVAWAIDKYVRENPPSERTPSNKEENH
jgi:hypothetical protein